MSDEARILLIGEAGPEEGSLRAQVESLGHSLETLTEPSEALSAVESERFDLVIIDATAPDVDGMLAAKHIKRMTRDKAVPVMFACHERDLRTEIDSRDLGADDCFAKPIDTQELGARIRLLLRNRALELSLRDSARRLEATNEDLVRARDLLDRELDLAGVIQRSLLPRSLPDLERYQFAAALHPSGAVSGDFYDLYRLDESRWGFYVADAVGHGVPAALLTIFVKKAIVTREILPDGYRLIEPGEVLRRLNVDLLSEQLSESPFVTLAYSILDVENDELSYASGGHPPAMVLGADGSTVPLLTEGALLGIFEAEFSTANYSLKPGDAVVLYTDGIEQAAFGDKTGLAAAIDYLQGAPAENRSAFARHVSVALDTLLSPNPGPHTDDATLLVLKRWK